jgi:archaellum component FlaG (FlaF/FlaG flagellin family)
VKEELYSFLLLMNKNLFNQTIVNTSYSIVNNLHSLALSYTSIYEIYLKNLHKSKLIFLERLITQSFILKDPQKDSSD